MWVATAPGYSAAVIDPREQHLMRTLWLRGRLSRWELHEQTGVTPNTVGTLADALLKAGLIRECPPEAARMGRPRVPLEIDPATRQVIGLALVPGRAEVARLGLNGSVVDAGRARDVATPSKLVAGAASLLAGEVSSAGDGRTLAVGVTATGFIDPVHKSILFSSALPGRGVETLTPLLDAAGEHPVVLGNDMQALAARWLLTHRAEPRQDVLLVWFTDGRLGSALLVDGRPNRGSVTGGNELGHTRFPGVATDPCFCGQLGCLERIVSTPFLHRLDAADGLTATDRPPLPAGTLADRVARHVPGGPDRSLDRIIAYLAASLSNAAIFVRPHRLVLVSPYTRHASFTAAVSAQTRALVLPGLADRLQIDTWDQASTGSAENAAWLAMAELLYGGWDAGDGGSSTVTANGRTNGRKRPAAAQAR